MMLEESLAIRNMCLHAEAARLCARDARRRYLASHGTVDKQARAR
jgi:hypothetical protein